MSTRGAYELADGTLVRTQGQVPKGQPIKKVAIPVGHQELIDYINGIITRSAASPGTPPASGETQVEERPSPPVTPPPAPRLNEDAAKERLAQVLRGMQTEHIEKHILESKGAQFGRYFVAALERFGGLGVEGWRQVHAFLRLHHSQIGVYDRGLHQLALLQIEAMNTPPEQRGKIAPTEKASS